MSFDLYLLYRRHPNRMTFSFGGNEGALNPAGQARHHVALRSRWSLIIMQFPRYRQREHGCSRPSIRYKIKTMPKHGLYFMVETRGLEPMTSRM